MLTSRTALLFLISLTTVGACAAPSADERSSDDLTTSHITNASGTAGCTQVDSTKRECTYKTVGSLSLLMDVFTPPSSAGTAARPIVMWIHGGALIFGNRGELSVGQRNHLLARGYVVASIDYRLAPETKLDQIHQDVADAYAFLRTNAAAFGGDANRMAVMGASAGGYLTLTAGARLVPKPRAVVSFYGYGDVRWYLSMTNNNNNNNNTEQDFDDDNEDFENGNNNSNNNGNENANMNDGCPTDPFTAFPGSPIANTPLEFADPNATRYEQLTCPLAENNNENGGNENGADGDGDGNNRQNIYACARSKGYWPQLVSGRDPNTDSAFFEQFEANRQITSAYPPTMLLHGNQDDDVPFSQSETMASALQDAGVTVRFEQDASWSHGFDEDWCSPTVGAPTSTPDSPSAPAFAKVGAFLDAHVKTN